MTVVSNKKLEKSWAEYLHYKQGNANFSAFARLGEITHCLQFDRVPPDTRQEWADRLAGVIIPDDELQFIRSEALSRIKRLERIIGVGGKLLGEEALLITTIRVDLELVAVFFAARGIGQFPDTGSLDAELLAIASSTENSRVLRSAWRSARRNGGFPLQLKSIDAIRNRTIR